MRGNENNAETNPKIIQTRASYTRESNNTAITGVVRMQTGSSQDRPRYTIDQIGVMVSPTN